MLHGDESMVVFLCVSCYTCKMFQAIQQRKSSTKFSCKMCNAKQSIRRVFSKSERAADIRGVVQALNSKRGEQQQAAEESLQRHVSTAEEPQDDRARIVPKEQSVWGAFVEDKTVSDTDEEDSDDTTASTCTTRWEDAAKAQRESRKVCAGLLPVERPTFPPDINPSRLCSAAGRENAKPVQVYVI